MTFPINLYLLSGLGGCMMVLLSLPLWRAWCRRTGLVDDPGHRKIHDQSIPLAGGLAILTGILLPLLGSIVAVKFNLLDVETADLERYPLEVEEAVYFSCRALRSRAAGARVWSEGATLRLELVGVTAASGGELSHARERIAAVGGQLDLSADRVSAAVPVR